MIHKIKRIIARKYEVSNQIDISRSAILHNFDTLARIHNLPLILVLKANAYGHGLKEVSTILRERSFPLIAVDGYFEAIAIREVSNQPILVMGSIGTNNINSLRAKYVSFVVFSKESFDTLKKSRRVLNIHLEINTGMNRHGLRLDELTDLLSELRDFPRINVEGIMTHLSSADELKQDFTNKQFTQFEEALRLIKRAGIQPRYIHATNSAGTAKKLPNYLTAVRPGIALYGINTLKKSDPFYGRLRELEPALRLTSKIDQIITVQAGDCVGYNRTHQANNVTRVATIPIGYYEGIPRTLSNKPFITSDGLLLDTTGTICMNHTMFDCTKTDLAIGDQVTIISPDNDAPNSIINLRDHYNLFEYSLPTGLSATIRRRLVS